MTDEELVKHCMCGCMYLEAECPNCNKVTDADLIEALTEQLEAARADATEAEAYAENLREERDTLRLVIEANIEKHRSRAEAAEAKLAKLMSIAKRVTSFEDDTQELAECGCDRCKAHLDLRALLAEIEGEKG